MFTLQRYGKFTTDSVPFLPGVLSVVVRHCDATAYGKQLRHSVNTMVVNVVIL